ncbi:MAG: TlyA family RNA methyltransferase, partial [Chthoniobacterales bacterium]|nr:TlyA family RNA methyltransferase [Chthoniobacterales bacterium]
MPKERADVLLVRRGLCPSHEKAQRLVMAGEVFTADARVDKPSQLLAEDVVLSVRGSERYVGRGGLKLEAGLRHFGVDPTGWTCLDVGASTGGFTDCLLQHGAARVYALDVGHGQLAWSIRSDPRVVVMERCNARHLGPGELPEKIHLVVADVSFISLTLVLPPAARLLNDGGVVIALIKPQFELARAEVGRGGIVREAEAHGRAVAKIRDFAAQQGWAWG